MKKNDRIPEKISPFVRCLEFDTPRVVDTVIFTYVLADGMVRQSKKAPFAQGGPGYSEHLLWLQGDGELLWVATAEDACELIGLEDQPVLVVREYDGWGRFRLYPDQAAATMLLEMGPTYKELQKKCLTELATCGQRMRSEEVDDE